MKYRIVFLFMSVLGLHSMTVQAEGKFSDPCRNHSVYQENLWLVTLNQDDESSKIDLIDALRLMGRSGFSVDDISSFLGKADQSLTITLTYSPATSTLGSESEEEGEQDRIIKEDVLSALQKIDGVKVECSRQVGYFEIGRKADATFK